MTRAQLHAAFDHRFRLVPSAPRGEVQDGEPQDRHHVGDRTRVPLTDDHALQHRGVLTEHVEEVGRDSQAHDVPRFAADGRERLGQALRGAGRVAQQVTPRVPVEQRLRWQVLRHLVDDLLGHLPERLGRGEHADREQCDDGPVEGVGIEVVPPLAQRVDQHPVGGEHRAVAVEGHIGRRHHRPGGGEIARHPVGSPEQRLCAVEQTSLSGDVRRVGEPAVPRGPVEAELSGPRQ